MNRILIVEDEEVIRAALKKLLEHNQYDVACAGSVSEATENHALPSFDLVITDLRLPGQPGTDLIHLTQGVPVLVMTSYASMRSAIEAMKLGAVDYIAKPFDHDEMLATIRNVLERGPTIMPATPGEPLPGPAAQSIQDMLYGRCNSMQRVFELIRKVAPTQATVLIMGESGTGKELAAKAIHAFSRKSDEPLICVNCAAIPETLIESELFGHEKGAFTGAVSARNGLIEAADGGTLFLDEIGELPLDAQARLLRVLQEGEIRRVGSTQSRKVHVRLIAATHRNLKALAKTGEFREDLYYRLNVIQIRLPPLRERGEDILGLAKMLLKNICVRMEIPPLKLGPDTMKLIEDYDWPGNVRELENALERASILCDKEIISAELLDIDQELDDINIPAGLVAPSASSTKMHVIQGSKNLSLEDYFQHFVLENQDKMSETELAQQLGISRKSLWERRQRLGIPRKKQS